MQGGQKDQQGKVYRRMVLAVQESSEHKIPMGEEQAQREAVEVEDQVEEGVGVPQPQEHPPTQIQV